MIGVELMFKIVLPPDIEVGENCILLSHKNAILLRKQLEDAIPQACFLEEAADRFEQPAPFGKVMTCGSPVCAESRSQSTVLEDIVVGDPEPSCGLNMPCVLMPIEEPEDEWLTRIPHVERVAEESAIPLADEVPVAEAHAPCFECGNLTLPRLLTSKGLCQPCAIKLRANKSEESGDTSPALEPWESRLLEIWNHQLKRGADIPQSEHIGKTFTRCRVSRLPELRKLYTADIRRELRRLGVDLDDPVRSGRPRRERGQTSSEPVAEPGPSTPAPASGRHRARSNAEYVVDLWNKYSHIPESKRMRDVNSHFRASRRNAGLSTNDLRQLLRDQGIDVPDPTPPVPPQNSTGETDVEMAVRLWMSEPDLSPGKRVDKIVKWLKSCRRGNRKASDVRAMLAEAGIDMEARCTCPPDASTKAPEHVHVAEPSNEHQVEKRAETGSPSKARQINPAMLEPPKVVTIPEKPSKSIDQCRAPAATFGIEVTLQLIHAIADRPWPLDVAAVWQELRPETSYGTKTGSSALSAQQIRAFADKNEAWLRAYTDLPPFRRRDIDIDLRGDWVKAA